jgi:CHASE2 domain-containing sensor protein
MVSENGYAGVFAESDTCASIAKVTATSANGPSATFTVTGVSGGSCMLTFRDAAGQARTVSVTVTTTGFVLQSRGRR